MKAKVLSVYDEGSLVGTPLIGARGLSVLVDADGERTLFDTGLRGNYLMHNMEHLSIDPDSVDRVVISHMHSSHIGGLSAFLEKREKTVNAIVTPDHASVRNERVIGIPVKRSGFPKMSAELSKKMNTVAVSERTRLSDNLFITDISPEGGAIRENALVLMTKNGAALICGCCHRGVAAAMEHVEGETGKKVIAVIGGTHLTGMRKEEVYGTAEMLIGKGPPALYLNHCSGVTQKMRLREKMGLKAVSDFYAGTEIQFDL